MLNADVFSLVSVFSWSELPELLAAEDLFDAAAGTGLDRLAVMAAKDDDDDDDEEDEEEFEDDDEDEDEDEELEDEDDEWEEVDDEEDEDEEDEEEDDEEEDDEEDEDEEEEEEEEGEDAGTASRPRFGMVKSSSAYARRGYADARRRGASLAPSTLLQ
jgi:hypothetical protein